jgi:hypothetical protein
MIFLLSSRFDYNYNKNLTCHSLAITKSQKFTTQRVRKWEKYIKQGGEKTQKMMYRSKMMVNNGF